MIEPLRPTRAKNVPTTEARIDMPPMREREQLEVEARERLRGEQHHRDRGDGVGLEQVGRHARAVADVVADVVGDHGRVARVVLGDPGLDLPDEVGADVGGLGVDAAAEPREDGDQRATEGEADEVVDRRARASCRASRSGPSSSRRRRAGPRPTTSMPVTEPARKATLSAGLRPLLGGLGGADVRAHGDVHADEAGGGRQHAPIRKPTAVPQPSLL